MTEKETTIYLLKFALEVIEGEGLERSTNGDNWVIGRDIKEHLEALQKENKSDNIDLVSDSLQANIRNKLSPLSNLIAMIENDADREWITKQIPQAKISIEYLSNYR